MWPILLAVRWRMLCVVLGGWMLQGGCASSSLAAGLTVKVGEREDRGELQSRDIAEASGIAASRRNAGVFWVHNDSGDRNRIFAIGSDGKHLGVFIVRGCPMWDWEDIAVGPGPEAGQSYIYIGDVGDNLARRESIRVCRVLEPVIELPIALRHDITIDAVMFRFAYPDQPHNAETLMVDPLTRDLYVVTKEPRQAQVYVATYPYNSQAQQVIPLKLIARLPFGGVAAGDITADGRWIVMKNLGTVWLWKRRGSASVAAAVSAEPTPLPYVREPQGEAIAWSEDGRGYVTVSERVFGLLPHLYFYPFETEGMD